MSLRIIIVAALAVLLVGWMLFRHPGSARTELPPAAAMVVVPDVPTPHVTPSITSTPSQLKSQPPTNRILFILQVYPPTPPLDQLNTYLAANHRHHGGCGR